MIIAESSQLCRLGHLVPCHLFFQEPEARSSLEMAVYALYNTLIRNERHEMQDGNGQCFVVLSSIKGNSHHEVISKKRASNTNRKYGGITMKAFFFNKG